MTTCSRCGEQYDDNSSEAHECADEATERRLSDLEETVEKLQQKIDSLAGLQEGITLKLEEGERQMVLMALAHLAVERPGWDHALSGIATRIDNIQAGRPVLFDSFKEMKPKGIVVESPVQAWVRAATLMRSAIQTHGKLADDDPAWGIDIPEYRPPEGA